MYKLSKNYGFFLGLPQTQEIREGAKEPKGGTRPTVHTPLRLQWVRMRSGSPLPPPAPHPKLGVCGGSYRFQLSSGCGGGLGMAILLPLHPPQFLTSSKGRAWGPKAGGLAPQRGPDLCPAYLALSRGNAGLELTQSAEVVQLKVGVDLEGKGHLGEVPPHTVHGEQHGPGPTQLGSARPGLGAERRGGGGAWLVLQADGTGCSLARPLAPSLPHTRSVTHSLPPSPASTAATTRLRLCLPPCRPASHHCRQARRPPGAPPRRNADAVNPAWPAPPSRRSEGAGLGRGGGKQERVGGGRGRRDGRRGRARKGMSRKEKLFIAWPRR